MTMAPGHLVLNAPPAVETADLHFKLLSKLKLFDGNTLSLDSNMSLLAVSGFYGLVFVGTSNGFLILKSKEVFSADCPNEYHQKEILLNSRTSHLAVSSDQRYLAVGCQTKMGPIMYIYEIDTFLIKGVSPMKIVPLSKPFQNPVVQLCDVMWQPNDFSALTACFSDGSVSSLSLFQGNGKNIFSLPNTTQARCMCWSPKGKQIVIGCNDGTLSQYTPELKFIKKLPLPPFFVGTFSVVNVLWISSFWFAVGYKDLNKVEEFPQIVIVNAHKSSPIIYVNYDDITYSTTLFRNHQLYFHHLSLWNIILLASANSIEVAVLHGKNDNVVWEQWLLGDASRAELPLTADKVETFPIGVAVDYTSDQTIPWGEESLPPAPRLVLLSSEGLLTAFNIINLSKDHLTLTQPPVKTFADSWFTVKGKNDLSLQSEINQPSTGTSISQPILLENMPTVDVSLNFTSPASVPFPRQIVFSSLGDNNFSVPHPKEEAVFPSQQMILGQQPQLMSQQPYQFNNASLTSSSPKWPQNSSHLFPLNMGTSGDVTCGQDVVSKDSNFVKNYDENLNAFSASAVAPKETLDFKDAKENLGLLQEPTQIKFNESADVVQSSSSAFSAAGQNIPLSTTPNLCVDQNLSNKNLKTSPSRSSADLVAVSSEIYVTALMDEIDHFDVELKDVLSRVSTLKVNIGTDEEKLNLRRSVEKLNDVEKNLNEITLGQKNEIHSVKSDVIEAFAWLEDARSRNRQRKSRTYIELKKSEDLDPMSNRIMSEISHMKYYIENQLKQLHSYLMREWMEHENNCRIDIKSMMMVPSMEELYKTMHLELKILNKLRATVEELRQRVTERTMKVKSQSTLITDSVGSNTKPADDTSRMSELYKLADNLLQIKIGRDESDDYISITDAFQLMIKNQINEIVERSKKFTVYKQNVLRDTFCEREMMKTRSVKSKFGSSYFIRNSSSRIESKYMSDSENNDTMEVIKAGNKESSLKADSTSADIILQTASKQEENIQPTKSFDQNKIDMKKIPVSEQSNTFVPVDQEISKYVISFGTPSLSNKSEIGTSEFTLPKQPEPTTTSSTVTETTKSESKTAPFVFKASPVFSFGTSSPQSQKLPIATSGMESNAGSAEVVVSSSSSNTSVFAFKAAELSPSTSTANSFTSPAVKTSLSFAPKTCTSFSSSELPAAINDTLIPHTSDNKISTATSTTVPVFSFSKRSNASVSTTTTAPSSSSTVFKFTTPASSGFKFTTSTGTFSFSSPFNSSKTNPESSTPTFSMKPPALSISFAGVTNSSDTTLSGTDTVNLSSMPDLTVKETPDAGKDINPEEAGSGQKLSDQESVLSTTLMVAATTATVTTVAANTMSDVNCTITAVTTSSNTPTSEGKTESESGKTEAKENMEGNSVMASNSITVEKLTNTSSQGKIEASSTVLSGFPQQSAIQVFTETTAVDDAVSSTSCSTPSTTTISFGASSKNIFSPSISISTTSSLFGTTGTSIFSSAKPVTANTSIFSATPTTTVPSSSIFSSTVVTTTGASPFVQTPSTTSGTPSFDQSSKDEVGKTTALFGDMLRSGLSTGSVFETQSTSGCGIIFGKSSFDKSGSSIFGNTGTTVTPATTTVGIFENTSNNIFLKPCFGQIPSSGSSNLFGQPQRENNSFFGQNICSPFASTTTTTHNQNPFASPTGFNSRPVFGQSLFGQSSGTGQNPLDRSSTTSIFGNSSSSSPSGGNIFQMGSSSFSTSSPGSFSGGQSTTSATSAFQKPIGGFGGSPVFESGLATATFGAPPTFGGASTFGSSASFGSSQKIFGSPQGTFGQNQSNFESLASESTDGFADLAQRSQSETFGGTTFNQNSTFGGESSFGGNSFSKWRS